MNTKIYIKKILNKKIPSIYYIPFDPIHNFFNNKNINLKEYYNN